MTPKLEEIIVLSFTTRNPITNNISDADVLPTCEVYEDANDTAIMSPTVIKRTDKTGHYRVTIPCTTANGFEVNKTYNVAVTVIMGGNTDSGIIETFQVRANIVADIVEKTNLIPANPALESTSQAILTKVILIPANPASEGSAMTLVPTALDGITNTLQTSGLPANFRQKMLMVYESQFGHNEMDGSQKRCYHPGSGVILATQAIFDAGGTQTMQVAT